ncbi:kelch-like protein 10 isoform X2 [Zootermopsis nevadensis]|uniref:kelch-like protein 10 isoform X2 n=1 Tax=Zootermopsis nevadensis TaxID=136037 RepID=UPI000B8E983E|nr:kelch-like protein 10 isoform X2 [Zootermopsis nevadensis]
MEANQHRSCFQVGGRCNCTETLVPLNELREENRLCDAVLRLEDGGVFPVHRVLLSMRSPYFRFHSIADLENRALRFVWRHFVEVSQYSEELLELPVEELQAIIESVKLTAEEEKFVWECILRWINHDSDNRKGHFADLLKGVRLGRLDAKFFKEQVSKHRYVTEFKACRPVISETLKFLDDVESLTKEDKDLVIPRIARPRIPQCVVFTIGGSYDGLVSDVIEAYDERVDRWSVVEGVDSIGPRGEHGTAVVGFNIYVIGGTENGFEGVSSCSCFNAVTKTCREVAPMHKRRYRLMVAVLRGAVYAMGGKSSQNQRTAERYDCKTNQWSLIAPMNTGRFNGSAAVLNDKIYVAGGCKGEKSLDSVEFYDPDTNRWTYVARMLSRRERFSCVAFHGCLYALGGRNKSSSDLSTEKYDPAEDTWTEIPAMNFYAHELNAEVIDDTIFVIGAKNIDHHFASHVAYLNAKENRWYQLTNTNVYRSGMSTCVIKNLPNASDYAYKHRQIDGGET